MEINFESRIILLKTSPSLLMQFRINLNKHTLKSINYPKSIEEQPRFDLYDLSDQPLFKFVHQNNCQDSGNLYKTNESRKTKAKLPPIILHLPKIPA